MNYDVFDAPVQVELKKSIKKKKNRVQILTYFVSSLVIDVEDVY